MCRIATAEGRNDYDDWSRRSGDVVAVGWLNVRDQGVRSRVSMP